MIRPALVISLLLAALGCTPRYPCLWGSMRGRYAKREDLQLLRREYDRAETAEPVERARILEALPRLFPDLSNRADAPECAPDLVIQLGDELDRRPLPFNNATLHYVGALGNVQDTTDVMPKKAGILLRLAAIRDGAVQRYQMVVGERGTPPDAAHLRRRATAELVASNLYLNDARVRRFLVDKALGSTNATEELWLFGATHHVTWDPKTRAGDALIGKWLDDARVSLDRPAEPARFELLLAQLTELAHANQVAPELKRTLERIIAADGALPITRGRNGWARELAVRARLTLWDVEDTKRRFSHGSMNVPFASRARLNPFRELFEDPTSLRWSAERVAGRLRQLDGELARIKKPNLRCWLLEQRAKWTPPGAQRALLEPWLADERLPTCAFLLALEAEALPLATRLRIAVQEIRKVPYRQGQIPIAQDVLSNERAHTVRWVIAQHLSWIAGSDELRAALSADALGEPPELAWWAHPTSIETLLLGRVRFEYQRALHETVALDTRRGGKGRERARSIVAHWIQLLRAADPKTFNSFDLSQLYHALLFAVAEFAPPLELEDEARPVLAGDDFIIEGGRYHELARWLFRQAGGR